MNSKIISPDFCLSHCHLTVACAVLTFHLHAHYIHIHLVYDRSVPEWQQIQTCSCVSWYLWGVQCPLWLLKIAPWTNVRRSACFQVATELWSLVVMLKKAPSFFTSVEFKNRVFTLLHRIVELFQAAQPSGSKLCCSHSIWLLSHKHFFEFAFVSDKQPGHKCFIYCCTLVQGYQCWLTARRSWSSESNNRLWPLCAKFACSCVGFLPVPCTSGLLAILKWLEVLIAVSLWQTANLVPPLLMITAKDSITLVIWMLAVLCPASSQQTPNAAVFIMLCCVVFWLVFLHAMMKY